MSYSELNDLILGRSHRTPGHLPRAARGRYLGDTDVRRPEGHPAMFTLFGDPRLRLVQGPRAPAGGTRRRRRGGRVPTRSLAAHRRYEHPEGARHRMPVVLARDAIAQPPGPYRRTGHST